MSEATELENGFDLKNRGAKSCHTGRNELAGDGKLIFVGLSMHPTTHMALIWSLTFLYMATLAGNSMILFLVVASPQLHTPMYFFLGNLSLLDLLFSTSTVPGIMVDALQDFHTVSYACCFAQLTVQAFLVLAESFLFSVVAYDRLVAISAPLRYSLLMSPRTCALLALATSTTTLPLMLKPVMLFPISFCGHNAVNHFSCEVQAIFQLLCSNTVSLEATMMVCTVLSMLVPLTFMVISYLCILRAVSRIHPAEAQLKAFSTCGCHLLLVTIYFGMLTSIYVRPQTKTAQDRNKIVSIFYAAVTPVLNSPIYSLRNKEVNAALRRVTCGTKS